MVKFFPSCQSECIVNLKINPLNLLRRYYFLTIALVLCLLYAPFLTYKAIVKSHTKVPINEPKLVEVEALQKSDLQQTIRLIGTIRPKHATILVAEGSGMLESFLSTGQKVKKGTLIAKIANEELEKNLELSQAAEGLAKTQYKRLLTLLKSGIISSREAEEKKQAWITAQQEFAKMKIELDALRFYAPFDGIIGAFKRREGTQVKQGDPVVTIYDPSALVVDFDIPCTNLTAITEGQAVRIFSKIHPLGHVQKMIDEETHMCPADVEFSCDSCVIGSNVDVDLVVATKQQVIVAPFAAVFLRNSEPHVYVVEDSKVVLTPVKLGIREKSQVEIISGLKPGQKLIIRGQERLYPGLEVAIYNPALESTTTTS